MTDTATNTSNGAAAAGGTEVLATKDPASHYGVRRHNLQDSIVQVGPVTHLAAERERLAGLTWDSFDLTPLGSTIGAELHGLDLREELSDDVVAEIRRALLEYKVIFFRDQPLDPDQHVAFAARFGALEVHPFIPSNTGRPELVRFEKSAETGGYENLWHHDVTWRENPSMGAILHAIEVPPVGGDTLFCDMYAAYEGLDDEVKERIEGRMASHDFLRAFGAQVPPERMDEMRALYPTVEHPIVVTHAETGRRHLYVNRVFTTHIVDMDPVESNQLLDLLCYQAETVEYQVRFAWRNDSIAFWDNRGAQHYASSDYWPQRRVMERASVVGGAPLP